MGLYYFYGKGVENDKAESERWWIKAFAWGHSEAATRLNALYKLEGVDKGRKEAWERYWEAKCQDFTWVDIQEARDAFLELADER